MDTFLQKTARLYRNPWPLLLVTLAATVFFALGMPRLQVDNDVKSMLPKTERTRALTELYDQEASFGSSNGAMIGIESPYIFSVETLTYIQKIEARLNDLNRTLPIRQMGHLLNLSPDEAAQVVGDLRSVGINEGNYPDTLVALLRSADRLQSRFGWDSGLAQRVAEAAAVVAPQRLFAAYDAPLGRIQSLVSADYITLEDDALVAQKLIPNGELTPENLDGLQRRVQQWDTYEGTLVSKDLSMTSINITVRTGDKDVKALFNEELLKITADPPAGFQVFIAGESVIVDHLSSAMAQDMPVLIPLMGLVLILILFFCFRTLQGIVLPLLLTVVAVIWTFGLMGYLGVPMTIISSTIPILLMAIVSAYGIHQMNHYYEDSNLRKYETLHHNAGSVGLAILLSGLTVMIGFGSMVTLDFLPIRDFGLFTAFGDLVGVLAALYLLPALLLLGKPVRKATRYVPEDEKTDLVARFLRRTVTFARARPGRLLVVVGLVSAVLASGAFLVKSNMDTVKFFPAGDSIRIADQVTNEKMAGTKSFSVILDTDLRDPLNRQGNPETLVDIATPAVLKKLDQFSQDLRAAFPQVTKVTSYADVLKQMNQVMNGGDPAAYAIPDDPALVSQYMVIFSGDTQTLLTANHDKLRLMVQLNRGTLDEVHGITAWAQAYFTPEFQDQNHLQVLVAGEQPITYMANQTLLEGNMESIFACVVIVFLLMLVVLRSLWMSLIAVVPVALCLIVNFGFLGFTGIELNTTTSLVSAIGIGIGIDFSIHFITWYRRELRVDRNVLAAVDRTIRHKGRAIVYNWMVIVGGFLVLLGSQMGPLKDFGLLTAVCLTVTAAGALVVVPALLRLLARKNYRFLYLGVSEADVQPARALAEN